MGDQSGAIHIWDLKTDHNEQLIPEPEVSITSAHIDPDASYMAAVNSTVRPGCEPGGEAASAPSPLSCSLPRMRGFFPRCSLTLPHPRPRAPAPATKARNPGVDPSRPSSSSGRDLCLQSISILLLSCPRLLLVPVWLVSPHIGCSGSAASLCPQTLSTPASLSLGCRRAPFPA